MNMLRDKRNLRINLCLFVLTSILCVAIAEIALRFYGITPSTDRLFAYEFDETLGWAPKQSFKYFRSTPYYGHFNYYVRKVFPSLRRNGDTISIQTNHR